jgi:mono/diheme cytochrome c family protein
MRFAFAAMVVAVVAVLLLSGAAFRRPGPTQEGATTSPNLDRGKYLVEDVGVCWTCHSPRTADGQPDRSRWLLGGSVPYRPVTPTAEWAEIAPRLSGLPPGTDEQFITLMTTGISRTGRPPRPPMPSFRMTRADAVRVLAYLKSLRVSSE